MAQDWTLYFLLLAASVVGLGLALLQLPGIWLIVVFAIGYAWATGGAHMGIAPVLLLIALAIIAEVVESLAAAGGAGKAGSSKTAMALSVVGAMVGGIALTFILPIPIIGTLVGVLLGAFVGAYLGDKMRGRTDEQAARSGVGAAIGRLVGTLIKLGIGAIMIVIVAIAAFPSGGHTTTPADASGVWPPYVAPSQMPIPEPRPMPEPPTSAPVDVEL